MHEAIILFLQQFPSAFATVILAALPITELRLAIPIAIYSWNLSAWNAFGLSVIGNVIPFVPLYFGLNIVRKVTQQRLPWVTRGIDRLLDRAKGKVEKKYARYGALALFLFTALPLPMTGLWTATLAAVALRVPFRYAAAGILCGVVCAGVIVTIISAGVGTIL